MELSQLKINLNKGLAQNYRCLKEEKENILGLAVIRQLENGRIQTPWEIPNSEEQFKHMHENLETAETWEDNRDPHYGKSKLLSYLMIRESQILELGKMKPTSLKDIFQREVYKAEENGYTFQVMVIAVQMYRTFYFHRVENVERAVTHFKNNYDEFFTNRFLPCERIIGFMLV